MTLTLDHENKIITIDQTVNLKEFFDQVKEILPDWKEWNLNQVQITYYQTPYIPEIPYPNYPGTICGAGAYTYKIT